MSNTNTSGKGAGIAPATQPNAKALTVVSKGTKTEETTKPNTEPKPEDGKTVVNVNVTNTASSEAKATATASAKVENDIHTQISKFEKLRDLVKQRAALNEGRDKITKIILASNDKNPLKVTFADVDFEADDYTFQNENLVRNTAEFVIGEFNRKLQEVEWSILAMRIA